MGQATTTCPEGCRLALGPPGLPSTKLYGPEGLELVRFPPADTIPSERQRQVTRKLFGHLERGVLLHSSRQGVFVKRLCQGRVFYSGNAVVCKGKPNKLERDEVVQVFDTSQFFQGRYRLPGDRPAFGSRDGVEVWAGLAARAPVLSVSTLEALRASRSRGEGSCQSACGSGTALCPGVSSRCTELHAG